MGGQVVSRWWSGREWCYPLAGERFGESHRVAVGDDDVGVVQEPVDGRGRSLGLTCCWRLLIAPLCGVIVDALCRR